MGQKQLAGNTNCHDDVMIWRHFPHYQCFVRESTPMGSPHKGPATWSFAFLSVSLSKLLKIVVLVVIQALFLLYGVNILRPKQDGNQKNISFNVCWMIMFVFETKYHRWIPPIKVSNAAIKGKYLLKQTRHYHMWHRPIIIQWMFSEFLTSETEQLYKNTFIHETHDVS